MKRPIKTKLPDQDATDRFYHIFAHNKTAPVGPEDWSFDGYLMDMVCYTIYDLGIGNGRLIWSQ